MEESQSAFSLFFAKNDTIINISVLAITMISILLRVLFIRHKHTKEKEKAKISKLKQA